MVQERAEGPKDPTALYLSLRPVTVGSGRVEPYMRKLSSFTGNILIGSYLTDNTLIECSLTESSLSKQKQKNGKRWKKQYPVIINSENSYAIYLIKVIVTPTETLYLCSIRIELISHNFIT